MIKGLKKGFIIGLVSCSVISTCIPQLVLAQNSEEQFSVTEYTPEVILIKMPETTKIATLETIHEAIVNLEKIDIPANEQTVYGAPNQLQWQWYRAQLEPETNVLSVVEELSGNNAILAVEPEYIRTTLHENIKQQIPFNSQQWYLDSVEAPRAWEYLVSIGQDAGGGKAVVSAVIDTGVDYRHADLKENIWLNVDEIANNGIDDDRNGFIDDVYGATTVYGQKEKSPLDDHGHGTHVAGIIAADSNGIGITGVAHNTTIMPVKAGKSDGTFTSTAVVEAIRYAVDNGANIINMSFGGESQSQMEMDALTAANTQVVLIAAAGNSGLPNERTSSFFEGRPMYPAAYPWVLGVMATEQTQNAQGDWLANFSNWDLKSNNEIEYEIAAPGRSILSTTPNNQYESWNGTSMASPVVAGVAALLMSKNNNVSLNPEVIKSQLISTGIQKQAKTDYRLTVPNLLKEINAVQAVKGDTGQTDDWSNSWAKDYIALAMEQGWVNTTNLFRPEDNITRAEFIKIANNAFGFTVKANSEPFIDVKIADWWYGEVLKAVEAGYITTSLPKFRPNDPITREEVAAIVTAITNTRDTNHDKIQIYQDYSTISIWAKDSVEGVVEHGYMGKGSNLFRPKSNITRAETVVTLGRIE